MGPCPEKLGSWAEKAQVARQGETKHETSSEDGVMGGEEQAASEDRDGVWRDHRLLVQMTGHSCREMWQQGELGRKGSAWAWLIKDVIALLSPSLSPLYSSFSSPPLLPSPFFVR